MRTDKIESLRVTFLTAWVTFGFYDEEDLVVCDRKRDYPTFRFERAERLPRLQRTSLEVSIRGRRAFVDWLYVNEKARRTNLGSTLYSLAEVAVMSEGIQKVELYARGKIAQNFWTENGFTQTGRYSFQKHLFSHK
jgi:GNAT superfamily N-acetyltransferase